jgi:hypothetical protein
VGPAIVGKAVEPQFEASHRRVGPDIGAAVGFDDGHLAEFHVGTLAYLTMVYLVEYIIGL